MKPRTSASPPLHPTERGLGGEEGGPLPAFRSGFPSPPDGEGVGGEATDTTHRVGFISPSPLAERGAGGEVLGCPSDSFRAGTRVKTEKGWRSIETLRAGDFVWTHLGRLRRVVGVQRRPHVGAMLGLQLESSPIVVWSTPAQQFLVAPGPHPPTP